MTDESYVFDTYAIIENIRGNPRYHQYGNAKVIITEFILAELCFNLIRELGEEQSYSYVDKYAKFVISVNNELIKKAMKFRFEKLRKDISMADCMGYFLAKSLGIKFLTGDKEFEKMEDVEFVK